MPLSLFLHALVQLNCSRRPPRFLKHEAWSAPIVDMHLRHNHGNFPCYHDRQLRYA
jgi:hypothetical protein